MHKLFDRFDKEDFYMIQFKINEYNQKLSSFETITFLWIFVGTFVFWGMNSDLNESFSNSKPVAYAFYFSLNFLYILQCILLLTKKSRKKKNYELRQAKSFFEGIIVIGMTFLLFGCVDIISDNHYEMYAHFGEDGLIKICNLLFLVQLLTILCSFLFLYVGVKIGVYKKNEQKEKRVALLNIISISAIPAVGAIIFTLTMIGGSNVDIFDFIMAIFVIFVGYLVTCFSAQFYMIYYLRRRFPEDYLDDRAKEEDHEN